MTFNNRVVKKTYDDGYAYYTIHEVFYNDKGDVQLWTEEPMEARGDSLQDLKDHYLIMAEAFKKPVLEEKGDTLVPIKEDE